MLHFVFNIKTNKIIGNAQLYRVGVIFVQASSVIPKAQ